MQYSVAAILALAASASAWSNGTISYTTDVVTAYTTYCPEATSITLGSKTYTVTEATTLTISECPCTIVKPVTTTSKVVCESCVAPSSSPVYVNSTTPCTTTTTVPVKTGSVGTTSCSTSSPSATIVPASGANKAMALSGASLAGLLSLVAYLL